MSVIVSKLQQKWDAFTPQSSEERLDSFLGEINEHGYFGFYTGQLAYPRPH